MHSKQINYNKKTKKRQLELIISRDEFDRYTDFKTHAEKLSDIAKKKAEKLIQLKKLSHEITKDWENSIDTIQKRRRNNLLSRRGEIENTKVKLMKELSEKNELERAEIVKEARKLILYRKPQYRLINRALHASECYRELNAQLDFKKELMALEASEEQKYIDNVKIKAEIYSNHERKKREDEFKKKQKYGIELKKQIEGSILKSRHHELEEINADKEDLNNMIKELQLIEKCEADQAKKRKDEAKKNYLEAIEEKKLINEKIKSDEQLENQLIDAYVKAKDHLNEITEKKWKQSQADKLRRTELLAEKCATLYDMNQNEAEENLKKTRELCKQIELEKLKSKRIMQDKMRADIEKYQKEYSRIKSKNREEKKHLIVWETLQRFKRDEYNKEMKLKELQWVKKNKMEMARDLRKQMEEREAARKRELIMEDDSAYIKSALERTNEKVLDYGHEILEESKGVRPLFPIIKAIETFKKDNGLIPPREYDEFESDEDEKCRKKLHIQKLPSHDAFYLG